MGIVRVQKNSNYSVISNVHLQDQFLSWKAKGLLSYLLSKPDNWQIYVAHLKNQSTDGRDATASGIRELINAGYISRDYSRNESGQITGRDYVVHESALEKKTPEKPVNGAENPKTENPSTVEPSTVEPELLNTDPIKYGLKKNTDDVQKTDSPPSLFSLIPEQHKKPSVQAVIDKGLKVHSADYVKKAILYTIQGSNGGTWQKFKAYLGKCIDSHWHDGWEPKVDQGAGPDLDSVRDQFKQMTKQNLKAMADAGNQFALDELARRK